jgi:serine/threonine protein kinase
MNDDPIIGTRIGDYDVERLLGEGGMGKVYVASDPNGGRVALKLVKEDYARDETFRRRFYREARIAQTVKHPNVVPVVATGEHQGLPYMAQMFVDGSVLDQKLKQEGQLDVASAVRICGDVAAGLEALWAAGMVHRDVKPANILLDESGIAYITDFGLAKDIQGSFLTLPGQALGSMDYMSPEQIRGEPVTGAADIYSLGCVAFECLLGRPPFADREGMAVLWAHLRDEPPDPSAERSDVSTEFAQALGSALRKQPGERPQTSIAFAQSLSRTAGIPITDPAS